METSIVLPNYNGMKWLPDCLAAIFDQTYSNCEVIMVDNNSSDRSLEFVRDNYPGVKVISLHTNEGFASAVNLGIKKAVGTFILLLNTDTVLQSNFLNNIVDCLRQADDDVGAVASKMLQMENTALIDDVGDQFSWYGAATKGGRDQHATQHEKLVEIFSPSGGAALYRKSFLEECGYFDKRFFAYLEDIDLGLRGRLMGYRYLFCPTAEVYHKSHGSQMNYRKYICLTTCNRLFLFTKNIPALLIIRNLHSLIYGQCYFFLAHGKPSASMWGYLRFFWYLPSILISRMRILKSRRLPYGDLEHLLHREKPEPSLSMVFREYLDLFRYRSK